MKSIYFKIEQNFDFFSKEEKKVAKYCIDNYATIGMHSLAQVSKNSQSGEATVVRFCNKLGFKSFKEFKKELANEVNDSTSNQDDAIVSSIRMNTIDSFDYIARNIDQEKLNVLAKEISRADKILCIGVGNSSIAAEACAMRLVRNGKNGIFLKDAHFQAIYINELKKNDVVIMFSMSGESKDLIHCANLINSKGITIISCTASIVSSVAKKSKYHLLVKPNHVGPLNGGSMVGQISQLMIADIITTKVAMIDLNATLKARNETYDNILDKMNHD